jgi:hypothetical protein
MTILIALMAFVAGICPAAAAFQLSMERKVPASAFGAGKRASAPAKPRGGTAQEEDRRLAEALNRLSPKERERLAKAMKRLTPEQRKRLTETLKRQLAGRATAPPVVKRAR